MLLLAEVGDKMPTVTGTAVAAGLMAAVFFGLGLLRRCLVLLAFPLVAFYDWAMCAELHEPGFGQMIIGELAWRYVIGCFAGWNLPFVLAFGVIALRPRRFHAPGCCKNCGHSRHGLSQPRCPERRTAFGHWLRDMLGSEKRLLRVLAWIAIAACTALLAAFVWTFVSPVHVVNGTNWSLTLDRGKYSIEPSLERLELPRASGDTPVFVLVPLPSVGRPLWPLIVGTAAAGFVLRRLGRRRPVSGHCRCGYELTGNVSGRCPECGTTL